MDEDLAEVSRTEDEDSLLDVIHLIATKFKTSNKETKNENKPKMDEKTKNQTKNKTKAVTFNPRSRTRLVRSGRSHVSHISKFSQSSSLKDEIPLTSSWTDSQPTDLRRATSRTTSGTTSSSSSSTSSSASSRTNLNENQIKSEENLKKETKKLKKLKIAVGVTFGILFLALVVGCLCYFLRPASKCNLPEHASPSKRHSLQRQELEAGGYKNKRSVFTIEATFENGVYHFLGPPSFGRGVEGNESAEDGVRALPDPDGALAPQGVGEEEKEGDVNPAQCMACKTRPQDGNRRASAVEFSLNRSQSLDSSILVETVALLLDASPVPVQSSAFLVSARSAASPVPARSAASPVPARSAAAGIDLTRADRRLLGRIWPSPNIVFTVHPSEESLWQQYGLALRVAMDFWESHTCASFTRRAWDDVPDVTLTPGGSTNTPHNLDNMVLVLTRTSCTSGQRGKYCKAHVGTPCNVEAAKEGFQNEPCIITCHHGVPWKMLCDQWDSPSTGRWGDTCRQNDVRGVKCIGNILVIGSQCEDDGVSVKTLVHELGHVLGLYHEMMRADRDAFVTVLDGRIKKSALVNFEIPSPPPVTLGTPYDYLSVMHYTQFAFTVKSGCTTIKTKDPCAQTIIGKTPLPSFYDIKFVNTLYKCNLHCFGYDFETWKRKNYGSCSDSTGCYHDPGCKCCCPPAWAGDVRRIPPKHYLHQFLSKDCRNAVTTTRSKLSEWHILICLIDSLILVHNFNI